MKHQFVEVYDAERKTGSPKTYKCALCSIELCLELSFTPNEYIEKIEKDPSDIEGGLVSSATGSIYFDCINQQVSDVTES